MKLVKTKSCIIHKLCEPTPSTISVFFVTLMSKSVPIAFSYNYHLLQGRIQDFEKRREGGGGGGSLGKCAVLKDRQQWIRRVLQWLQTC